MPHPFGRDEARYTWCMLCQRVFLTEDWEKNDWMCPGENCPAPDSFAFPWLPDSFPRQWHPEYPEEPVVGGYYPIRSPLRGLSVGRPVNWPKYFREHFLKPLFHRRRRVRPLAVCAHRRRKNFSHSPHAAYLKNVHHVTKKIF